MATTERLFDALEKLVTKADIHLNEYKQILRENPIPWSNEVKANIRPHISRLQNHFNKWNESVEKLEAKAAHMRNDDAGKQELFDRIDNWINDETHDNLKDDIEISIERGNGYIDLIAEPLNSNPNTNILPTQAPPAQSRIPPLNIQKFDGSYLNFNSFWQRFKYLVHDQTYPKVEKLITLFGLLDGKALKAVEGFQMAEENYDTVIQILSDRFGNKNIILQELHAKLRSIQRAKPTAESLRDTVDSINKICRELKNFGVNIENDSTRLDIIDKMPPCQKDELSYMNVSNPRPTTDEILEKMNNMVFMAEISSQNRSLENSQSTFSSHSQYSTQKRFDTSTYPQDSRQRETDDTTSPNLSFPNTIPIQNNNFKFTCSLCEENHLSSNCPHFSTVDQKINQLKLKNFCIKCARRSHTAQECRANVKCSNCSGNHYAFLCKTKNFKQHQNGIQSNTFVSVEKQQGCLLTKEVTVMNPETNETSSAVIFFDTGSQRSFVSEKLIGQLKLPWEGKESLNIQGIGAKALNYISYLTKLRIKTVDGFKDIYANSIRKIANTVPVIQAKEFQQISTNPLNVINKQPDILIGMDYFFEFITSFKSNDGNFIVESKVGEMLSKKIQLPQTSTISTLAIESQMLCNFTDHKLQNSGKLEAMGVNSNQKREYRTTILEKFKESKNLPAKLNLKPSRTYYNSTLTKLQQNPTLMKEYQKITQKPIAAGKIQITPEKPQGGLLHYVNKSKDNRNVQKIFPYNKTKNHTDDSTFSPSDAGGGECLAERYFRTKDRHKILGTYLGGSLQRANESGSPKGLLRKAKITKLLRSSDGNIRSVEIEYDDGFITRRAINHLNPLEEPTRSVDLGHTAGGRECRGERE